MKRSCFLSIDEWQKVGVAGGEIQRDGQCEKHKTKARGVNVKQKLTFLIPCRSSEDIWDPAICGIGL